MRLSYFLKQRHLSVRGSGLVANTILLSKVWHVLRVVLAPSRWIKDIKSIVSQFVLPFWPRPSFSVLCLPRKHGGLGLIDINQQHLALHLVYIQRLVSGPSNLDFVSPWLVKCFQIYTGHASLLPWFFNKVISLVPTLSIIGSLLLKLPNLEISKEWTPRWFLDLPLYCVTN